MKSGVRAHPDATYLSTNCLPALFARRGYETTAIHGFDSFMFSRTDWYPKLGFQHILFREQLRDAGYQECVGAFTGICDDQIPAFIGRLLIGRRSESAPQFVYWLTLQSHLPVVRSHPECSEPNHSDEPRDMCEWSLTVQHTLESLANLAVRQDLPATEFIIVGDHAPPFMFTNERDMFVPHQVPYIHLVPREPRVSNRIATLHHRMSFHSVAQVH